MLTNIAAELAMEGYALLLHQDVKGWQPTLPVYCFPAIQSLSSIRRSETLIKTMMMEKDSEFLRFVFIASPPPSISLV